MPYTYSLVLFCAVIICFIASFHRRIKFNRHFGAFIISATIVAAPFILWDIWFTMKGVWWFNHKYTAGINIAGLPLEEWLFFYCIPFACIFTYYCLDKFFNLYPFSAFNNIVAFVGFIGCGIVILLFSTKLYTTTAAVVTLGTLVYLHFIARKDWLAPATFVYLVLMPGFFAVNGILTGTLLQEPVVNYTSSEIIGRRLLTIPVEDIMYGFSLFLLNVYFFKLIAEKKQNKCVTV